MSRAKTPSRRLRLATWNVNSVRQRLDHLARFVDEMAPDVICLQETKATDEVFPREAVQALGYPHLLIHGQKGYNGVAILSRIKFDKTGTRAWCGRDDRRHAFARLAGGPEVHSFYVPKGGHEPDPESNDKFAHKLQFLGEMATWAKAARLRRREVILVGDLNVAPLESDVWNHARLKRSIGHTPVECDLLLRVLAAGGLIDTARHFAPEPAPIFTWWGYRFRESFARGYGWRLDHILATPPLESALAGVRIMTEMRTWERPSDHVPVVLDLT